MKEINQLKTVKIVNERTYPLPQSPIDNTSYNLTSVANQNSNKLGLGVNVQTGRLQWCPGLTCCKFMVILPVIMLPITLLIIIFMRLDNLLTAMQIQDQQYQLDKYEQSFNYYYDDGDEQQPMKITLTKADELRIQRCLASKLELQKLDKDETDLLKDIQTSFIPEEFNSLPDECLKNTHYGDLYNSPNTYLSKRMRRTSNTDKINSNYHEDKENLFSSSSFLQSFWNDDENKQSIRNTQAKTMLKHMDYSIDPCDDFYKYACGKWEKLHPIPKDKAGYDTFEILRENLDIVLKNLLENDDSTDYNTDDKEKRKLNTIENNNFDNIQDIEADIISKDSIKTQQNHHQQQQQEQEEMKEKTAAHILKRRDILKQLLYRYKRQTTTNTNRKHNQTKPK